MSGVESGDASLVEFPPEAADQLHAAANVQHLLSECDQQLQQVHDRLQRSSKFTLPPEPAKAEPDRHFLWILALYLTVVLQRRADGQQECQVSPPLPVDAQLSVC